MQTVVQQMLNKAWWQAVEKNDFAYFEMMKNNLYNFAPEEVDEFYPYAE